MTNSVTPDQVNDEAYSEDDVFVFPASSAQQRLWLLDQLTPSSTYNVRYGWRLVGAIDPAVLQQSIDELVWRQESLRTVFTQTDGELMQVIDSRITVPLTCVELPDLPAKQREEEIVRLATEVAERPFDLTTGPLVRATLLKLSAEEHFLLVTVHHIIADGWSMGVFAQELSAIYTAFVQGEPSPLPDLEIQYVDYVAWHQQWMQGQTRENLLDFWKKQLGGTLPVLQLPTDRPRPAVQSYRGESQIFHFSKEMLASLRQLCQAEGVTPYMALLSVYQVLLYRYTGEEDVLVGSPIAGRGKREIENVIGMFMNMLVLRTDLSGEPTFRELLARVREVALSAYSHQDLPFEQIVEELQPERNLSHSPIFQVMFSVQNTPAANLQIPELTSAFYEVACRTSKFDLSLIIDDRDGGMMATFEYNIDLFDAATMERMAGHFFTLLQAACTNPQQKITELPLLTDAEREQVLVQWNDTGREDVTYSCMHHLFEQQAERTPDRVAVVFEGESLTYRELNQRSNQLAHLLQKEGVGSDQLVGICMERSVEMIVGLLGILKAGGAYVPLDPSYPEDRLAFMVEDAGLNALVSQSATAERFAGQSNLKVIALDAETEGLSQQPITNPASDITADHLAYVIYTSGSTGKPKGVLIEHRSVANFFDGMDQRVGCSEEDAMLAVTSIGFDISVLELFWTLTRGCKVVLLSEQEKVESGATTEADYSLPAQIAVQGITMLQCTPSLMKMIIANEANLTALQPLRKILLGGEAMPPTLAEQLRSALPARLLNMYGPTEATIWATTHEVTDVRGSIPIGKPIMGTQTYVLDRSLQPVPIGVAGELYIGGMQLARGYLNRPELTAEKFIPHPFLNEPGARLYQTGDVARYLPDGSLDIIGRADHQVKLRGFRIELGEIETALTSNESVAEAVVIVREDTPGDQRLVAYLVAAAGHVPMPQDLRQTLKAQLPEYMVPALFVLMDSLPLTPNGKIDRKALPAPSGEGENSITPPTTDMEKALAQIWCELLGVNQVGIHDSFFALGGHSLLATQLISRVRITFQAELTLRHLFDSSTIAELAQVIEQSSAQTAPQEEAIIPLVRRPKRSN